MWNEACGAPLWFPIVLLSLLFFPVFSFLSKPCPFSHFYLRSLGRDVFFWRPYKSFPGCGFLPSLTSRHHYPYTHYHIAMHHQFFQYPPCSSPLFSLFTSVPIPIKSTSPIPLTIHLSHHRFHHPKPAYPFFSPPFSFYTPHACHLYLHNTHKHFTTFSLSTPQPFTLMVFSLIYTTLCHPSMYVPSKTPPYPSCHASSIPCAGLRVVSSRRDGPSA